MWMLKWNGRAWASEDLTGDHAALIVVGLGGGDTWEITPTLGIVHLIAVLAAFVSLDSNRPYVEVVAELRAEPFAELVGALEIE